MIIINPIESTMGIKTVTKLQLSLKRILPSSVHKFNVFRQDFNQEVDDFKLSNMYFVILSDYLIVTLLGLTKTVARRRRRQSKTTNGREQIISQKNGRAIKRIGECFRDLYERYKAAIFRPMLFKLSSNHAWGPQSFRRK